MTLQTDLEAARDQVQADQQKLKDIVNGPASGAGSTVTVDSGTVKTVARALAEIGDTSNQALKDLTNVLTADFQAAAVAAGVGGSGDGDMVAANNLSDVADAPSAFGNIKQAASESATGVVELATEAEAIAGVDTSRAVTAAGVAAALAAASIEDQVARDLALTAYIKADIAAADPAGVYGDIMSDNFTSDTLATQTNATYDAAGDFYHNPNLTQNATGESAEIGDTPTGGAGALRDGSVTTGHFAAGALKYFGVDWGLGTSKALTTFTVKSGGIGSAINYSGNNASTMTFTLYGSNTAPANGTDGTALSSAHNPAANSPSTLYVDTFSADLDSSTAYRYHWIYITSTQGEISLGEIAFAEQLPTDNMTLRPSAVTLPTANPLDMSMYFRVRDIDVVTEGTDRVVRASIDGGTTWAAATITSLGDYGSTDKLIRADADVSAQTGSSFVWEITTANNKEQQIKQVASVAGY